MQEEIKAIVESYGRDKAFLVPILQDIQARHNYLPQDLLLELAEELGDSPQPGLFRGHVLQGLQPHSPGQTHCECLPRHCLPRAGRAQGAGRAGADLTS